MKLKLAVMNSAKELGSKVDLELQRLNNTKDSYLVNIEEIRFGNEEGKIKIDSSIYGSDLYILGDIGNYGVSYKMHGKDHFMAPDEHFMDIRRVAATTKAYVRRSNVIMPLLYESRQHKRKDYESLDCAISLQELERLGVDSIITFDAHDPSICNAVPELEFDNFYPTNEILSEIIKNENLDNVLVISPDMGATERARVYAEMLSSDVGVFYKRRDLSKIVNGKNPIVEHMYMGADPKDKDILIVDDMISSGSSILEVANMLKDKGAKRIFVAVTFALFTDGIKDFDEAYNNKLFTRIYTTNLSYIPEDIKNRTWYKEADISKYLAFIIDTLSKKENINTLYEKKAVKMLKREK